jgi:hypothetical protein
MVLLHVSTSMGPDLLLVAVAAQARQILTVSLAFTTFFILHNLRNRNCSQCEVAPKVKYKEESSTNLQ